MVDDVEAAIAFYTTHFGFDVLTNYAPAFADVQRGNLRLLLSGPSSSAARPMPDGRQPGRRLEPHPFSRRRPRSGGGAARASGLTFRNDIVKGPGGSQILVDDPAGNPIELFQSRASPKEGRMKIATIGRGNVGSGLHKALAECRPRGERSRSDGGDVSGTDAILVAIPSRGDTRAMFANVIGSRTRW